MAYVSKKALGQRLDALENSKAVMMDRLGKIDQAYAHLGPITNVVRDGFTKSFDVGGVMHVEVNAWSDTVTHTVIGEWTGAFEPVTIELSNAVREVDFTLESAKLVLDTFKAFKDGPDPSDQEIANAFNVHVA